jgi:hypothetical protein
MPFTLRRPPPPLGARRIAHTSRSEPILLPTRRRRAPTSPMIHRQMKECRSLRVIMPISPSDLRAESDCSQVTSSPNAAGPAG